MAVATKQSTNGHPNGNGAAAAVAAGAVRPRGPGHSRGRRSGTYAMVAIHSTALGPALGGVGCGTTRPRSTALATRSGSPGG